MAWKVYVTGVSTVSMWPQVPTPRSPSGENGFAEETAVVIMGDDKDGFGMTKGFGFFFKCWSLEKRCKRVVQVVGSIRVSWWSLGWLVGCIDKTCL